MNITNTGPVTAAEVPQLYVGIAGSDVPKQLRGFDKIELQPGESAAVTFELRRRDLSIWDVEVQEWRLGRGAFTLMIGKSVLDIVDTVTLELS